MPTTYYTGKLLIIIPKALAHIEMLQYYILKSGTNVTLKSMPAERIEQEHLSWDFLIH